VNAASTRAARMAPATVAPAMVQRDFDMCVLLVKREKAR
jgi:hypothetical protein